jgi:hypothetical protein
MTLDDYKKLPQDHYCDFHGRRMQVKDIVVYLENERKRYLELIKKSKEQTDIK